MILQPMCRDRCMGWCRRPLRAGGIFFNLAAKAWVQDIPHAMEKFRVPPFLEMGYPKLLFFIRWLI